jgi:hypothetical protein
MKPPLKVRVFLSAAIAAGAAVPSDNPPPVTRPLSAPTYYIAAEVVGCEQDPNYVEFRGASNLPPGAVVEVHVTDFAAWKTYSADVQVPLNEAGFFAGKILPNRGMRFRYNLTLVVTFTPFRPKQPDSVLQVIGKKGEKLEQVAKVSLRVSDSLERPAANPQVIEWSGEIYGLQTIATIPNCGEKAN